MTFLVVLGQKEPRKTNPGWLGNLGPSLGWVAVVWGVGGGAWLPDQALSLHLCCRVTGEASFCKAWMTGETLAK